MILDILSARNRVVCMVVWTLLRTGSFEICVGETEKNNQLVRCVNISPSTRHNGRSKFIVWYFNVCLCVNPCVYIRDGRGGAESARVNLSDLNISALPLDEYPCY